MDIRDPGAEAADGGRRERARSVQSGEARAAVLGVNDGLVTNVSLIVGMVGAAATPRVVLLAGVASLVAGACSMAVGEYVSMRAQVELLERLLAEERAAIEADPAYEQRLLEQTITRHGLQAATARAVARDVSRNPDKAIGVYARSVLGLNPQELGSPWGAALSSLLSFAAGALVPLLPWLLAAGHAAFGLSLMLAGAAALGIGGFLGRITDGRVVRAGLRQLLVIALASSVTYLVGRLFGSLGS